MITIIKFKSIVIHDKNNYLSILSYFYICIIEYCHTINSKQHSNKKKQLSIIVLNVVTNEYWY